MRLSRRSACRSPAFRAARSANICIQRNMQDKHATKSDSTTRIFLNRSIAASHPATGFLPSFLQSAFGHQYETTIFWLPFMLTCPSLLKERSFLLSPPHIHAPQRNRLHASEIKRAASVPYSFPRVHCSTPSSGSLFLFSIT